MPNVADELEELRKRGAAKQHAASLESKGGGSLSTPEAEEAALKAKAERERVANYGKEAEANLRAGAKDAGLEDEFKRRQAEKKREDRSKKEEAAMNLRGFKGADGAASAEAALPIPPPSAGPAAAEDDDDDDDVPELEEAAVPDLSAGGAGAEAEAEAKAAAEGAEAEAAGEGKAPQNRSEKKARKMMSRLGMRPVPGIARVTLKTPGRGGYFAIDRPDVFVSGGGGRGATYVIFGEARQGGGAGGMDAAQQQQMRQAQAAQAAAAAAGVGAPPTPGVPSVPTVEEIPDGAGGGEEEGGAEEEAAADETGVEAKDVDLVVSQAGCSRAKAVAALKENDGDLVNAIMALTT